MGTYRAGKGVPPPRSAPMTFSSPASIHAAAFSLRCRVAAFLFPVILAGGMSESSVAAGIDPATLPPASAAVVDFARDIEPLLTAHCVKCHGPEKQKGGLRLDHKAGALQGGDDGKVLVPGKGAESRLVHLVAGLEEDKIMPPKGERLTAAQIGLLRAWIDQGALWPDSGKTVAVRSQHWSLQPLKLPPVPDQAPEAIDAFIRARLMKEGLTLSPEADRATLIRRLSFDLIGLPPTPGEVDAFVADASPQAYAGLVERLLASPHYGERWGRHWLDVARYTESQGFEYDRLRDNAWHYRDYVIRSFNADKPYNRFMEEQIAGDVMEPVTSDGIVATSLLVCGPWDQAGNAQANATQRAITREDELEDMLGVVGQSFLGLTVNCARCHTHKFDPIPHADYYRMKSVFEGVKHGERPIAGAEEIKQHNAQSTALEKRKAEALGRLQELEAAAAQRVAAKKPAVPATPGPAPYLRWDFSRPDPQGQIRGKATTVNGALKLENEGDFFQTEPIPREIREKTLEAWVSLASLEQGGGAPISLQLADGSRFDAIVFAERQHGKWMAGSEGFSRSKDLDIPEETAAPGTFVHLAVVYGADNSISLYRNGEPLGKSYTPGVPLQTYAAGSATILLGRRHSGGGRAFLTGDIRQASLYARALTGTEVAASYRSGGFSLPPEEILAALSAEERQARALALAEIESCRVALEALPPVSKAVSYAGVRVQPAPTRRLIRGEVNSPDEVVTPGALTAIADLNPDFGMAADAPENGRRLKFAAWLGDPKNPLPARVMVNRIWHLHFGQGLVNTPNDFGASGARPTHPELLDWLAVQFIQSGWKVKDMHRLIVNSATYRQASVFREKAAAVDADNQWLWRYTPRRLEAEAVRDAMLAVSGQLNPAMGGPSFRPFSVTDFNATFYTPEDRAGPEFSRRTVYRINVNSGKDPLLDAFDCPDPAVKTPRRGATTTPLQALELMNNAFVQRQAKHLAERVLKTAGNEPGAALTAAYRLTLGRSPDAEETARAAVAARERGLQSVCWALLNSTEFVYMR